MLKEAELLNALNNSLYYLYVEELRDCCRNLNLCTKGKKLTLISRIVHFARTGERLIYAIQHKQKYKACKTSGELKLTSRMIEGIYKNDLQSRLFFKRHIGEHFHFTVFGLDWLAENWARGINPTCEEFIDMWQKEYSHRQTHGSKPKVEWAYINFVQRYLLEKPGATQRPILAAWAEERKAHKERVGILLSQLRS